MSDVFGTDEITWSQLEAELRRLFLKVHKKKETLVTKVSFIVKKCSTTVFIDTFGISVKDDLSEFEAKLADLKEELEALTVFHEGYSVMLEADFYSYQHMQQMKRDFTIILNTEFIYG